MPTLRLLLALSLIALGTTGAAFAISGYFDQRQGPAQAPATSAAAAKTKLDVGALKPRQRFVAIEAKAKPVPATTAVVAPAARPKPATSAAAKAPAKKPAPNKDPNVQQAAAWWPLSNLFKN